MPYGKTRRDTDKRRNLIISLNISYCICILEMDLIIKITHLSFRSIRAYAVSVARKHPWGVDPTEHTIMFDIFLMLCNTKKLSLSHGMSETAIPYTFYIKYSYTNKSDSFTVAFL